jgi:tight adherence protein B
VRQAISQAGNAGARQVVVLSDGADTGDTALPDVVRAAKQSEVTVNVVALEQSAANQAKLRQITGASGGSVLAADDPDALAKVFTAEADALAQQVLVEFTSEVEGEATIAVSLDADGETFSDSTFTALAKQAETKPAFQKPIPVEPERPLLAPDTWLVYGGAIGIGLALAVAIAALFALKPREKQSLTERHLAHYANRAEWGNVEVTETRSKINVRDSAVAVAEQVVSSGGFEERLTTKLSAAGLTLTAAEWLLLHSGIVVLSALVGFLLSGGSWLAIAVAFFFAAAAPWLFLSLKRSRRVKAFNSQLADTLQLMSGGLSAGLSLAQAVDTVVKEGAEPMSGELRRALVEQRLGVDIEDALEGVGDRMDSKDFNWVVMAIRIQREVGGNLAELLNTVAATLREREYLRRQVLSLSAEGRLSAWILGGLPPVFAAYLAFAQPAYLAPLVTTTIGWTIIGTALVMLAVGVFWLAKTVKVEV